MSPDTPVDAGDVPQRQFSSARRGLDSGEVRAYLHQLAEVIDNLQQSEARERQRAEEAEERARQAEHPDEHRLMEMLGDETARVLDAARDAAAEIREKAEASAARLISDANEQAHQRQAEGEADLLVQRAELTAEVDELRREAADELERRRAEADELVAEIRREAELAADGLRQEGEDEKARALADSEALRDAAREESRRLVAEAQTMRERVLVDLSRRRHAAREQLERLNAARDRLLAAYEVVRRTVGEATTELNTAVPEAKVAGDSAMRRVQGEPELTLEEMESQVSMARITGLLPAIPESSELDELLDPAGAGQTEDEPEESGEQAGPDELFPAESGGPSASVDEAPADVMPSVDPVDQGDPVDGVVVASVGEEAGSVEPAGKGVDDDELVASADEEGPTEDGMIDVPELFVDAGLAETALQLDEDRQLDEPVASAPAGEPVVADEPADAPVLVDAAGPAELSEPLVGASPPVESDDTSGSVHIDELFARLKGGVGKTPSDDVLLRQRDETLEPLERALARRLKRVLADEQNEVLDMVRRGKAETSEELLPEAEAHAGHYGDAAADELQTAAYWGAASVEGELAGSYEALAHELGLALTEPLSERVVRSLAESEGDADELTERLRALYREWKNQRIGALVRHYVAAAYALGAYDAVPEGALLRWVVDTTGTPCPDAEDNALAGSTCKGESFPTGHCAPPAHPGCRCLIVPTDAEEMQATIPVRAS